MHSGRFYRLALYWKLKSRMPDAVREVRWCREGAQAEGVKPEFVEEFPFSRRGDLY